MFSETSTLAALQELLTNDADFMQPAARRNEVLAWVKAGLRDFSISRAAVDWGIRIPRDPSQTIYVWCALMIGSGALHFEP